MDSENVTTLDDTGKEPALETGRLTLRAQRAARKLKLDEDKVRACIGSQPATFRQTVWGHRGKSGKPGVKGRPAVNPHVHYFEMTGAQYETELLRQAQRVCKKKDRLAVAWGRSSTGGSTDDECTAKTGLFFDCDDGEEGDPNRVLDGLRRLGIGAMVTHRQKVSGAYSIHVEIPYLDDVPPGEKEDYQARYGWLQGVFANLFGLEGTFDPGTDRLLNLVHPPTRETEDEDAPSVVYVEGGAPDVDALLTATGFDPAIVPRLRKRAAEEVAALTDGWSQALKHDGLTLDERDGGGWEITCPLYREHPRYTEGETAEDYFAGRKTVVVDGRVICSGSCCKDQGRTQTDYRNALSPEARKILDRIEAETGVQRCKAMAEASSEPALPLGECALRLAEALAERPGAGRLLIKIPTGVGKTEHMIDDAKTRIERGERVTIAVPTKKVRTEIADRARAKGLDVHETGALLDLDDDGEPLCVQYDLANQIQTAGGSVNHELCGTCEHRDGCPARALVKPGKRKQLTVTTTARAASIADYPVFWDEGFKALEELTVTAADAHRYRESLDGTGAMYEVGVWRPSKRARLRPLVDVIEHAIHIGANAELAADQIWDRPDARGERWGIVFGIVEREAMAAELIAMVTHKNPPDLSVSDPFRAFVEEARARVREPGLDDDKRRQRRQDFFRENINADHVQEEAKRLLREARRGSWERVQWLAQRAFNVHPGSALEDHDWRSVGASKPRLLAGLRVASDLFRIACAERVVADQKALHAQTRSPQMHHFLKHGGVFADATAVEVEILALAPDTVVESIAVADAATKLVVYASAASRKALLPWKEPAWSLVEKYVCVALDYARDHDVERLLLGTFQKVSDRLQEAPESLQALFDAWRAEGRVLEVIHFGPTLRGQDRFFQEDFDGFVSIGDPRENISAEYRRAAFAGIDGGDLVEETARGTLAQFHGRSRSVRRADPIFHLHVGQLLPTGWRDVEIDRLERGGARGGAVGLRMSAEDFCAAQERAGLTNGQAAELIGVSLSTVERYRKAGVGSGRAREVQTKFDHLPSDRPSIDLLEGTCDGERSNYVAGCEFALAMEELGLSARSAARRYGISASSVSIYRSGRYEPAPALLARIRADLAEHRREREAARARCEAHLTIIREAVACLPRPVLAGATGLKANTVREVAEGKHELPEHELAHAADALAREIEAFTQAQAAA